MNKVKKIAIIGVGFMGGSLALALRKKFPKISICGFARSQKSYKKLKKLKILNKVERDLAKLVSDADLVAMALPIEAITKCLVKISPWLKKSAIVFDLGSSKEKIQTQALKSLPKKVSFVGCHPLAGSQKAGAEFSRKDLYQGSLCLITSSPKALASKRIKALWESLGSKVLFVGPKRHDQILSLTSHLPHLISFSLTKTVPESYLKFSAGSLKDLTRISDSPAWLWTDIFLSNRKNILNDLQGFIKILKEYQKVLRAKDKNKIARLIKTANLKPKPTQ